VASSVDMGKFYESQMLLTLLDRRGGLLDVVLDMDV
jgi:hypothetical protein